MAEARGRLPVVKIDGRNYFSDYRLEEFRAVDNPNVVITWDEYDDREEDDFAHEAIVCADEVVE